MISPGICSHCFWQQHPNSSFFITTPPAAWRVPG